MFRLLVALVVLTGGDAFAQKKTAAKPATFDQVARQAAQARESERLDEAIRLYRQATRLRPSWTEGWWYLGTMFYELDRYEEGRDALRRYLALDPKAGPGHALLGLCLFQTKQYELSLVHLRQAGSLGFGSPRIEQVALFHTGLLLARFEQFEEALRVYRDLVQLGNESAMVVEATGIAALRKPLLPAELPPQDREIVLLTGRAVSAASARRAAEADEAFKLLVARYPDAPNVHYLYGSFLLNSEPETGLKELLRELEISPRHLPALAQVAFEYQKRGEPDQGMKYAEKAVEVAPKSFVAHNALGRLLVDSGQLEKGIVELERSRQLAPDSPQTRFALASAYSQLGRKEDAEREMKEFQRLQKLLEESGRNQ